MPRASSPPPPPAAAATAANHPQNPHLDVAVTCLWVLTPLTATLSLVIICVAMTTNQWLHTEEKMTNPNYNGTGERDYLSKYTVSGLWTLCYTNRSQFKKKKKNKKKLKKKKKKLAEAPSVVIKDVVYRFPW